MCSLRDHGVWGSMITHARLRGVRCLHPWRTQLTHRLSFSRYFYFRWLPVPVNSFVHTAIQCFTSVLRLLYQIISLGTFFCFCIPVIGCSMSISGCRVFISGCRQTERGGGEKRTALAVSPSSCVCPLIMCMNVWVVFKIPFVLGQRLIQPAVDDFELPRKFSRTHRPSQFIALIHKC